MSDISETNVLKNTTKVNDSLWFSLLYEIVKDYLAVVAICIYSSTWLDLSIRFNAISKYDC
jgi:hypothetical protein